MSLNIAAAAIVNYVVFSFPRLGLPSFGDPGETIRMINDSNFAKAECQPDASAWKEIVARYQQPSVGRGVWQIVNTLVPYAALWYLMYLCLSVSYWLVVPLAILAGAFLVRLFIIHHDCGHSSFFKSRKANEIWGFITGVLTFTPYYHWRWEHAVHHATSGDLDRRGLGDIWTLTVQEYLESSRWRAVRGGAALHVSGQASVSESPSQPARAALGLLDEFGNFRIGGRPVLGFRHQGVFADPIDRDGGGRYRWSLVVLRAASV